MDARISLLVTLSDGKPDDRDPECDAQGIGDTWMAVPEARRKGVHPYCITIDTERKDYLPHLYGGAKLPRKVSDIYHKITS